MKILLKSATIIDDASKHHQEQQDILIENGNIVKIAPSIEASDVTQEISRENLHVSSGWFDSSVSFGEPGYEERETIENGLQTAACSGFSNVALNTNTNPVADSKGIIKFIKSKAEHHGVNLYPIGALTVGSKGEDLAELFDMKSEGAISFYDYKNPIANANLLKIALQYCQNFDGLVQSFPLEKSVARNGLVHEDVQSTRLGLRGLPAFSEELQIKRDLTILEYTGGKLHIPTISTKNSVAMIRDAKKRGLNVSCSVAIFNLILNDSVLDSYDSNYKLMPPVRSDEDIEALIEGLNDGTIDGVTSDHNPINVENKKLEFEYAHFGSIGLESCFGALNKIVGTTQAVKALNRLKTVFEVPKFPIAEGEIADLTLFNPDKKWTFSKKDIVSTSKNAALIDLELQGKPYGVFANNQLILNN